MRNAAAFLKPIAHRGLHDAGMGVIENTAAAFEAAIAKGYGIECDVRPAKSGAPVVFHDATLERLTEGRGSLLAHGPEALAGFRFHAGSGRIIGFAELLHLVGGRQPLLVEIKSEWEAPDRDFLQAITKEAAGYSGPLALMSFDPDVMAAVRELAPEVPRGIVSGLIADDPDWQGRLGAERAYRLTHLLESRQAAPDFYAYQVGALPTPVTRFVREVLDIPLYTWTVRSAEERAIAARWADAAIFEGFEP